MSKQEMKLAIKKTIADKVRSSQFQNNIFETVWENLFGNTPMTDDEDAKANINLTEEVMNAVNRIN